MQTFLFQSVSLFYKRGFSGPKKTKKECLRELPETLFSGSYFISILGHYIMPMPPMPPAGIAGISASSLIFPTAASVVKIMDATLAAF